MNTTEAVLKSFRHRICESVRLVTAGTDRYRVVTPFMFDDGDHLAMVLKREGDRWLLSDEGHTLMRLTYKMDSKALGEGNRARIIENTLSMFGINVRDGELRAEVEGDEYGGALYSLAQAIIRVSDVSYLSREVVRSTFLEDFRQLMRESAKSPIFDWHDDDDPEGHYPVDCYIPADVPLLVFALANEDKVKDATISILKFENQRKRFRPIGIFQDMEEVGKRAVARLTDVVDKQFSSLEPNRDRIKAYIGGASSAA